MRERLVPDVIAAVRARGFESGWYGNFVEDERVLDAGGDVDPQGEVGLGWMSGPAPPALRIELSGADEPAGSLARAL